MVSNRIKDGGAEKNKGDAEKNKGGDEKNKGGGKVAKSTTKATGGNEQGPLSSLYVPVPTAPPPTPPRPSLPTFWNNRPTAPPPTAAMPSLPTFYNIISRPVPTAPPPSPVAPPPTWPAAPPRHGRGLLLLVGQRHHLRRTYFLQSKPRWVRREAASALQDEQGGSVE